MKRYKKTIGLSTSLVAPPALSLAAFLLCLSAVLIPPGYYSSLMMERDLMFLNVDVLGVFVAFWFLFITGYFLGCQINVARQTALAATQKFSGIGTILIIFLLITEVLIFIYSFNVLYHRVPNVFINFMTNNVENTKRDLMVYGAHDAFTSIVPISNGTFWWVTFRWEVIVGSMSNFKRRFMFYPTLSLFVFVILAYSFLLGARYQMVPLLFGLMVIFYLKQKAGREKMRMKDRIVLLLFPVAIIAVFAFFSVLRGASGHTGVVYTMVGYGPASYNRLAAILNGSLDYNGQSGSLNEFGFLFHFPLEYRLVPVDQIFNLPDINEIQIYSNLIKSSHLMPGFTWGSIFGEIYSDLGVLSFPYMFCYGVVAGLLWKSITHQNIFGILLYPFMAYSIMMWIGYGVFGMDDLSLYIFIALILQLIEKIASKEPAMRIANQNLFSGI